MRKYEDHAKAQRRKDKDAKRQTVKKALRSSSRLQRLCVRISSNQSASRMSVSNGAGKVKITCTVNDEPRAFESYPMARLLDVLREELKLTGTKEGCGEGECGACSVLVDGALVNSCLVPVLQIEGARVKTIEGVASGEQLHAVQEAFLECGGAQCGICTPGMVIAAVNLLEQKPQPTDADIRAGLAGNLCRCTGYMKIFEAVVHACEKTRI
jgi:carbon-monoxide dehydrogenase small subunit